MRRQFVFSWSILSGRLRACGRVSLDGQSYCFFLFSGAVVDFEGLVNRLNWIRRQKCFGLYLFLMKLVRKRAMWVTGFSEIENEKCHRQLSRAWLCGRRAMLYLYASNLELIQNISAIVFKMGIHQSTNCKNKWSNWGILCFFPGKKTVRSLVGLLSMSSLCRIKPLCLSN